MPASGPGSPPEATIWSTAAACLRASSPSVATNALIAGFNSSIRLKAAAVSSRADTSLWRTDRAREASDVVRKSMSMVQRYHEIEGMASAAHLLSEPEPSCGTLGVSLRRVTESTRRVDLVG